MTTPSKQQTQTRPTTQRPARKTKAKSSNARRKASDSKRRASFMNIAADTIQTNTVTPSSVTTVPVLAGFYYAVSADDAGEFTMMQVVEVSTNTDLHTAIKIRQFAPVYKVLPDYLIPEQLGFPVAQFWLPLDELVSWQPLLMQRGIVATERLAH